MARYTPNGPARLVLAALEHGAGRAEALNAAFPDSPAKRRRREGHRILCVLQADGLAHRDCVGIYHLTTAGALLLAQLRTGEIVVFPAERLAA